MDKIDWYWIRNATDRYMSSGNAIRMLVDTVSKGGNLLLNVPLTPEGELEPTTLTFLTEMGKCLDIIGESIFATRCWMTATDGDGGIRFTRSKDNTVLYVINLGWSNDQVGVRALGSSRIDLTTLTGVSLLGSSEKLTYSQDAGGLTIKVGKAPFESPAYDGGTGGIAFTSLRPSGVRLRRLVSAPLRAAAAFERRAGRARSALLPEPPRPHPREREWGRGGTGGIASTALRPCESALREDFPRSLPATGAFEPGAAQGFSSLPSGWRVSNLLQSAIHNQQSTIPDGGTGGIRTLGSVSTTFP